MNTAGPKPLAEFGGLGYTVFAGPNRKLVRTFSVLVLPRLSKLGRNLRAFGLNALHYLKAEI